jgi:UDP-N-acetylmuramate: L-alanyl-gamma-D-glutamyl-meso-diaminopimelate ligase
MDLANFIEGDQLLEKLKSVKHIFFYRICGTGMGAAACLLKEAGYEISGSDLTFSPPMSTYLDTTGITCYDQKEVNTEFLKKFDLIIVGNSVPRNSDYAKEIETCGVSFTSFPEIIGKAILKDKNVIGVAGTHGKTTTTYFMTQLLQKLNQNPGYFIGGILDDAPPAILGDKYFVIESDEYDSAYFQKISKFRLYEIDSMLLTSLEFDHADIYDTVEDIEKEFAAAFEQNIQTVIADSTYESTQKLSKQYDGINWIWYAAEHGPEIVNETPNSTVFKVKLGESLVEFTTNIIGQHNILNITGCLKYLFSEGFKVDELQRVTKDLGLVKRRQEVRGYYQGSVVIDDFAHHPRAVKLTIETIKTKYPDRKIVTVFEPISATARSSIFQTEFRDALSVSNSVILAQNPLQTTVRGGENLDCEKIVSELSEGGVDASCVTELSTLQASLKKRASEESVLLILSNRTCLGLWESEFVNELS